MTSSDPNRPYAHIVANQQPIRRDTIYMESDLAHVVAIVPNTIAGVAVAIWWHNQTIDPRWSATIGRRLIAFLAVAGGSRVAIALLNIERALLNRR